MKTPEIILLGYAICIGYASIRLLIAKRKFPHDKFSLPQLILVLLLSPFIILYQFYSLIFSKWLKPYKHYFDKSDTPYVQTFQPNRKYHTVWKRCAYKMFLKHQVVKVKFLGLFTIYKKQEANPNANN